MFCFLVGGGCMGGRIHGKRGRRVGNNFGNWDVLVCHSFWLDVTVDDISFSIALTTVMLLSSLFPLCPNCYSVYKCCQVGGIVWWVLIVRVLVSNLLTVELPHLMTWTTLQDNFPTSSPSFLSPLLPFDQHTHLAPQRWHMYSVAPWMVYGVV